MKLVLTGGGTAGHIYPALALANKLKSDGHEVLFIGTEKGLEAQLVPAAGFDFIAVKAAGFDRAKPYTFITSGLEVLLSSYKAQALLKNFGAEVVIGFGGYVSIPVSLASRRLRIPLVIHEQNSVPGLANKQLAKSADLILASYESSLEYFPKSKRPQVVITGNPVREEIQKSTRPKIRSQLGLESKDILLVLFGGSRGARTLNTEFLKRVSQFLAREERLFIIQATGEMLFEEVQQQIAELKVEACFEGALLFNESCRYQVRPYFHNLGDLLSASDIVVCRAGATTLAELSVLELASLLVPYPYATDDHQTKNAEHFANAEAALMLADSELKNEAFTELMTRLIVDEDFRENLKRNMRELAHPAAVDEMVDSIYSMR